MQNKHSKKEKRGPSTIGKLYLLAYNGIQAAGWSFLLFQTAIHFLDRGTLDTYWDKIKWTVIIFQNAAILEVLHAAIGLVPSSVAITLAQVYSRVYLVCGALMITKAAQISPGLPICAVAWSITEIVRYSYYALNLLNFVPEILLILRYSLFLILYPMGISGELLCLYDAYTEVSERQLWTFTLPNEWNFVFNYSYFILFYMFLYLPLSPVLYMHMVKQRSKMLGPKKN